MEVPEAGDVLPLAVPVGVRVTWLPRTTEAGTSPRGLLLTRAVMAAVTELAADQPSSAGQEVDDVDIETGILWEVPEETNSGVYAWLAGEAAVVKGLRRHLVSEVGVPRGSVAFMGYWREGRVSD